MKKLKEKFAHWLIEKLLHRYTDFRVVAKTRGCYIAGIGVPRRESVGDPIPISVCSESPDYKSLRAQLNDFTSIFYGPFLCEGCGCTIVRQARGQGGKGYHSKGGKWLEHFDELPAVNF